MRGVVAYVSPLTTNCAIDMTLFCQRHGQLGLGVEAESVPTPTLLHIPEKIHQAACGTSHTLLLSGTHDDVVTCQTDECLKNLATCGHSGGTVQDKQDSLMKELS